jgi:hypothetical protein
MLMRKDWEALKSDYLTSKFVDVTEWGKATPGLEKAVYTGHFSRKTKGWHNEKLKLAKELSQITVQKVLEKRSDKLASALGEVYDHLVKNKDVYMAESAKGLETVWKIIMTANGQATSISRNDNTNHNIELEDSALNGLVNAAKDARAKRKKK